MNKRLVKVRVTTRRADRLTIIAYFLVSSCESVLKRLFQRRVSTQALMRCLLLDTPRRVSTRAFVECFVSSLREVLLEAVADGHLMD